MVVGRPVKVGVREMKWSAISSRVGNRPRMGRSSTPGASRGGAGVLPVGGRLGSCGTGGNGPRAPASRGLGSGLWGGTSDSRAGESIASGEDSRGAFSASNSRGDLLMGPRLLSAGCQKTRGSNRGFSKSSESIAVCRHAPPRFGSNCGASALRVFAAEAVRRPAWFRAVPTNQKSDQPKATGYARQCAPKPCEEACWDRQLLTSEQHSLRSGSRRVAFALFASARLPAS